MAPLWASEGSITLVKTVENTLEFPHMQGKERSLAFSLQVFQFQGLSPPRTYNLPQTWAEKAPMDRESPKQSWAPLGPSL